MDDGDDDDEENEYDNNSTKINADKNDQINSKLINHKNESDLLSKNNNKNNSSKKINFFQMFSTSNSTRFSMTRTFTL